MNDKVTENDIRINSDALVSFLIGDNLSNNTVLKGKDANVFWNMVSMTDIQIHENIHIFNGDSGNTTDAFACIVEVKCYKNSSNPFEAILGDKKDSAFWVPVLTVKTKTEKESRGDKGDDCFRLVLLKSKEKWLRLAQNSYI